MKIVDFKRDEAQNVVAILESGTEVVLASEYIAANKPQVGDEYAEEVKEVPQAELPIE